jgi:hypothetical protein
MKTIQKDVKSRPYFVLFTTRNSYLDVAASSMLGPQLDRLEPLNVFSVEEHEANSGHSFVHLKKGVAPKAS